jgi:hypothetical protein
VKRKRQRNEEAEATTPAAPSTSKRISQRMLRDRIERILDASGQTLQTVRFGRHFDYVVFDKATGRPIERINRHSLETYARKLGALQPSEEVAE